MSTSFNVVMPYYKKLREFKISFQRYLSIARKGNINFHFSIMVDSKNPSVDTTGLISYLQEKQDKLKTDFTFNVQEGGDYNISWMFNNAEKIHKYTVLTSPECIPNDKVFSIYNSLLEKFESQSFYAVTSCYDKNNNGNVQWFCSIKHNKPTYYHFLSIIKTEDFDSIQMDEEFDDGYAFDDNAFVSRVANELPFVFLENTPTIHQNHGKERVGNYASKHRRNKRLYETKYKDYPQPAITHIF